MTRTLKLLALAILVGGCASEPSTGGKSDSPAPGAGNSDTPPVFGAPPTFLNSAGAGTPMPAGRLVAPRDPVLVPGDILDIAVYDQPDLKLSVRIPESGVFSYPLIGIVQAQGLTPTLLEQSIRERLAKDFLQNPQVSVTVAEFALRKVFILGGVAKPDGYALPASERITILQLISVAGGITDKAYKEFVQIVRQGPKGEREVIQISLVEVEQSIAKGKGDADIELQPDDLVMIPSAARVVYVLGAVQQPGWFEIPADTRMTASMSIARAGSFTKFAATGSIQVLRQKPDGSSEKIEVDLGDIVSGKLAADVVLRPGDVVWIPERKLF